MPFNVVNYEHSSPRRQSASALKSSRRLLLRRAEDSTVTFGSLVAQLSYYIKRHGITGSQDSCSYRGFSMDRQFSEQGSYTF